MVWRDASEDEDIPRPLTVGLSRLSSKLGLAAPGDAKAVFEAWAEVAGDQVKAHARPSAFRNDTLVVEVDDSRWATQLRWLSSDLANKINGSVGKPAVQKVEVRLTPR